MLASREKISTRQAVILFLTFVYSPAIRLFPVYAARIGERAGWLAPVFVIVPFIFLVYTMQAFFKEEKEENLSDIICKIMGRIPGKILIAFYLLWIMVLLGLYVRHYSERFLTSLLPNTPMVFFTLTILAVVFFVTRGGIVLLARGTEFFFLLFSFIFIILFLLTLTNVELINLLPVTHYDIFPVIKSTYSILGIWAYFTFIFFFGDEINDKENIRIFGIQGSAYILVMGTMLLVQTIGVYGYSIIQRAPLPYFLVIKSVAIMDTIERIESVALAFWVIVDFVIISVFLHIITSIIKSLFSLSQSKTFISPITIFAFIFSFYIAKNLFELENFSNYIGLQLNIFFGFIIPYALYVIGRVRNKI